jgi:photosystem II stability/assembly factor-like uncharacterized protein
VAKVTSVAKVKSVKYPYPIIYFLVSGLILLLSLNTATIPTQPVTASSDAVKWNNVNIPTEGSAGDWVLADGSDVQHLTMASDGTLYAYGKGLTYTLYKSTDDGGSWSHIGNVQDAIVGIATPPNDTSTIYYATSSAVYRSTDGGKTFHSLPVNPGGAGSNNIEITSIDVAWLNNNIIAIGTRDTDNSEFGGVYTLDEEDIILSWTDANIGSYDVYAVSFSPNYATDRQLVAVITDETDTLITTKIGDFGWGATTGNARLDKDNSGTPTSVAVATSAAIAFPSDYDSDATSGSCVLFIAIDTGTDEGDIYKISGAEAPSDSAATDLNMGSAYGLSNIDVTGLAAYGDTPTISLLAGSADSAQTYSSTDGGQSWIRSRKEPTGESSTCVLMATDFSNTGKAYAATSGDESAFSISQDNGNTWNQVSLIDTDISNIVDLAPSPRYSQDNTLFMITYGGEHSLWRSLDSGNTWVRTFASALSNVDSLSLVDLPPQYDENTQTVFIAGKSDSQSAVWESTDNGQSFRRRFTHDPTTFDAFSIDTWAVLDDTTLFIGSYNGSTGLVYHTTDSGFTYSRGAPAGSQSLNSVALSPSYEQDETILIGNTNGWVYWSDDNSVSFEPLPPDATSPPLTGSITVGFDPAFDSNSTIYAASNTANKGTYRFIIGTSTDWESINGTLPSGAMLNQLVVAGDGTLYAANSKADGGMERCLNPTYSLGPTFETVTCGLSDGATLSGLRQIDHRLWSIDTTNTRLMTFTDTLTVPVTQTSPDNTASGTGNLIDHNVRNVSLDWETLEGATSYQWQLDYDTDFSSVPSGFEDNTKASSVRLPTLESDTTYYWRVRANTPVLSPWSEKWSFTTSLDAEAIALRLESPEAGASGVPVKPVFQWNSVAGADAYELLVSADADFSSPSIIKKDDYALSATAWQCDLSLDYDTTYYWKVRATNASTHSAWSAVSAFITESPPTAVPEVTTATSAPPQTVKPPEPEPTNTLTSLPTPPSPMPTAPQAPTTLPPSAIVQPQNPPDWVIYLIGGLFLTIIMMLIIIMTMVLKIRRL